MAAIPPVLAATAPAPENFRSLRRSIRAIVFPPYHPEAFRCIGSSLKPTAAWHKPAPHLVRQKVKGSGRAAGLLAPFGSPFSGAVPFERIGFEPSDGMRPRKSGLQQRGVAGDQLADGAHKDSRVVWPTFNPKPRSTRTGLSRRHGSWFAAACVRSAELALPHHPSPAGSAHALSSQTVSCLTMSKIPKYSDAVMPLT